MRSISRRACSRSKDPKKIAASLKRSAEASKRRKADPFRSAMSMLVFYINRAGKTLERGRPRAAEKQAKDGAAQTLGNALAADRVKPRRR